MPRPRHVGRLGLISALGLAAAPLAALPAAAVISDGPTFISEIHYDNAGTDTGEFVEVAADPGTDLTGWSIVLYNGNGGAPYNTVVLTGPVGGSGVVVQDYPTDGIQNGAPDAVARIDDAGAVVEFLSYEGDLTAAGGSADGTASTDIDVAEVGNETPGLSLQRVDGVWQGPLTETRGERNEPVPFISEIHYDNDGADVGEAVEVQAAEGTDLTGWSLELYNGSNGESYDSASLPAGAVGMAGVVVVAIVLQNGAPDGIALVDAAGEVVEFLSYEGELTAANGPAATMTSTDIVVEESASTPAGQSLQKVDGEWVGPVPESFGEINSVFIAPPAGAGDCGATYTPTYDIQGSGDASEMVGDDVVVQAVVVGDVQDGGLDGFYIQDAEGDNDATTSDGLFVYGDPAELDVPDVSVGDTVRVGGTVSEFFGQTQVELETLTLCDEGSTLPPAAQVALPVGDISDLEAFEGMRASFAQELTVSEVYDLNRFGEVVLSSGGRLLSPTEVAEPGAASVAVADENDRNRIILDDGSSGTISDSGTPPYLTVDDPVRVGDTAVLDDVVLGYGFDAYRLQPADGTAEGTTFEPTNPRPAEPQDVGGDVKVAAFNVLNYFTTLTSENSNARGATNPTDFQEQETKIVEAISRLDADVVALMEIENSAKLGEEPDEALAALVSALNEDAGSQVWRFVPSPENLPPVDGQDFITNAIIYRSADVETVGASVARNDEDVWSNAREPIAQTFRSLGAADDPDDLFTVVANHFKSKGGATDPEAVDDNEDLGRGGQGAYNGDRTRQAADVVEFAGELTASSGDDDVLLMGDVNAYSLEDPIDELVEGGFTDLAAQFAARDYSYVFMAESGSLDHALGSAAVTGKVTDVDIWNINAVESYGYQYDGTSSLYAPNQFRASDHDPIVVGLDLAAAVDPTPMPTPTPTPTDPGAGGGGGDDDGTGGTTGSRLPRTGTEIAGLVGLALVLLAGGATAVVVTRRRSLDGSAE